MKVTRFLIIVLVALLVAAPAGGKGTKKNPESRGIFHVAVDWVRPDGMEMEAGSGLFMGDPQGTSIREGPMDDFDLSAASELFQCLGPNSLAGSFAISVYVNKKSGEITYFAVNFYNFTVNGDTYTLSFGPDDVDVPDASNWLPSGRTSNTASGNTVRLTVNKGPQKNNPCPDVFAQAWKIVVTRTG